MPVADQVKSIIVRHLGLDTHELAAEALFRDGLGADSLDAFELLMAFEDEFDIAIRDEDAGTMQCVQDAITYIESRVTAGSERRPLAIRSRNTLAENPVGEGPRRQ
jgi:acyl carrier protein